MRKKKEKKNKGAGGKKKRQEKMCVERKNERSKQRKGQKCEFYDSPLERTRETRN